MSLINSWDKQVLLGINGMHNPILDEWMWVLSSKLLILPIVLGLIVILRCQKHSWKQIAMLFVFGSLIIVLCDVISTQLFKEVFHRLRPSHNSEISPLLHYHLLADGSPYLGGKYGFVSSHAANFAGFAVFFWTFFRQTWQKILVTTLVLLTMYSRMYLGVHYLTDVVCGALLGMFLAYMMRRFLLSRFIQLNETV